MPLGRPTCFLRPRGKTFALGSTRHPRMQDTAPLFLLSAYVHPPETNDSSPETARIAAPDLDSLGTVAFRHAGWASWRRRVRTALVATAQPAARVDSFDACGSHAWLAVNPQDRTKYKLTCDRCHDRFCTPCANERSRTTARVISEFIADKEVRFLTLTLRTEDEPLAASVARLIACFRKLRGRPYWKRHTFGGASFLEVKWNAESDRWHPHLHILQTGRFMERKALSTEWYACTGDSYVIDIRAVKDNAKAATYVAKYATKGYSASIFHDHARLEEAILALKGVRLMMCFGTWRGFVITDPTNPEHWEPVTSLSNIRSLAEHGSQWAIRLLQHLANPDSYHTPGPIPDRECEALGLPAPPPIVPIPPADLPELDLTKTEFICAIPDNDSPSTHTPWRSRDERRTIAADANARARALYNGFAPVLNSGSAQTRFSRKTT